MALSLLLAACSDRTDPSADGTLAISTSTLPGGDPDQDGYLLAVDGLDSLHLDPTGTSKLDVPSGQHTLALLGVAEHCSVTPGTSLQVDVPPGGTSSVTFLVSCPAAWITTRTFGLDIDGTYRVRVNGTDGGIIRSNDTVLTRLEPGTSTISLTDLAPNCIAAGPASREVTVTQPQVIPVEFSVACTATSGVIVVVVDPAGPVVRDIFGASLDGVGEFSVALSVPHYTTGVSAGDHVLSLRGSDNCSVAGSGSKPATVTAGTLVRDTVEVDFLVNCTAPPGTTGTVRITAPTTGSLPSTTQYTVCFSHWGNWDYTRAFDAMGVDTCGGLSLGSLDPSGSLVTELTASSSDGQDPYWYGFTLTDVPANCSVQDPVPNPGPSFQILLGDTLDVKFAVTCSP